METLETTINGANACLVLTPDMQPANYLPLSVIRWQTCMKLMCLNKITPVHLYEDRWIRTPRMAIQLPAVAVTREHFRYRHGKILFSRSLLFIRDLYQCAYCDEQFSNRDLTVDHVIPRAEGGKTSWDNCVTCCKSCNQRKGTSRWRPNREPFAPDYYTLAAKKLSLPLHMCHASWQQYLSLGKKRSQIQAS